MDLLLISLLLLSAFSHVYPSTINEPNPLQHNTSKANSLEDASKKCICWPDGLPPTVQQLDSQDNGLERLVIYLYKNDATNEIKMYTPNANKQMLIPEIPYEAGDGLVPVTTETVYTLLYNNPYKIKVYNDHIEKLVPGVTESLDIGLNTGAIEDFYPNGDNYLNPDNNNKGNEYSLTENTIIANGQSAVVVNEPEKGSTNIPSNVFPQPYNPNTSKLTPEQNWMPNIYPYTNPDNTQAVTLNPQTAADIAQTIPEDSLAIPVNLQSPPYKLEVTPINSQSVLPNAQAFPQANQDHSTNPQVIPGIPQASPGSYEGGLDQNVVYTFMTDQGLNKLQPGSQDINIPLSAQMTFNIWFQKQMKRFQNVYLPIDIKTIDSHTLKILVQKTFLENNIYISSDGVITDAKGIVIDASNIELRPLLLGEKFSNKILQNAKVIKFPKNLPYLEGILVTLVSPPQVLGIIPLGKTYLTQTYQDPPLGGLISVNGSKIYMNGIANPNAASQSTSGKEAYTLAYKDIYAGPTKYYAYSAVNGLPVAGNPNLESNSNALPVAYSIGNKKEQLSERNYWSSGPYQTVPNLPYPTANWNPSELKELLGQRRKNPDAVIQHHYEQPLRTRKKGKGKNKPTDLKEDVATAEPFPSINATESGRRFPSPSISTVMKTLMYLLNDLPSRRNSNSTGVDIVNESESNNDGGAPDFRIIGGNAATGSGTPLSNKGRSGLEYA